VKDDKINSLDFMSDPIKSTRTFKIMHEWEQSISEPEHVIFRLTVYMKRRFIGIEIDLEKFHVANSRLVNVID
jgi:hypothetical protein